MRSEYLSDAAMVCSRAGLQHSGNKLFNGVFALITSMVEETLS